jgi:PAS domain S-box-containing protein
MSAGLPSLPDPAPPPASSGSADLVANDLLRLTEASLVNTLQAMGDAVIATDAIGRITRMNRLAESLTGWPATLAIGLPLRKVFCTVDLHSRATTANPAQALIDNPGLAARSGGDALLLGCGGVECPISSCAATILDAAGKDMGVVLVFRDIRARIEQTEELARQRTELEHLKTNRGAELAAASAHADAANRAKSDFLAHMSHEIRTPMHAIMGLNQLVRLSCSDRSQVPRLDQIAAAGQHLLAIIDDLLDLSKIEAGHAQLDRTDFRVDVLLDEVRSLVEAAALAKGLRLTVQADADVPLWLHGDPTRLRQVLLNFAGNAVKFTEQGEVVLRAERLDDRGHLPLLQFTVEDTGVGLAADQVERLFQPFEQADAGTARNKGGTGLGLAINRRLAQMMGGQVGAHARPGGGSRFWLTARWPLGQGPMPETPTVWATLAQGVVRQFRLLHADARILLAEDDPINRDIVLYMLQCAGLTVQVAPDGLQALARARAEAYDLILLDMQMPGLDGPAVTRALRAGGASSGAPVLALTASAFAHDRLACEAAGMNGFLTKPVEMTRLLTEVLHWLTTSRQATRPTSPPPA